jgi:membrane protease subunit (stomatin/prohibitin family)
MGILDFLSGQFIDVIHWTDDTRDTMVWRFEREGHGITVLKAPSKPRYIL